MPSRRQTLTALGLAGAGLAGATACTSNPLFKDGNKPPAEVPPKASATITTPEADAKDVPAGLEFVFSAKDSVDTKFELLDANGTAVAGALHPDGAGWLPAKMLSYGAAYSAKLHATGDDGKTVTAVSNFTVRPKPSNEVPFVIFTADNTEIGTGMPLILEFNRDIPKDYRAAIQRRMMVNTEPHIEGVWHWYTTRIAHWRPKEFWPKGTKIFVDYRIGGMPCGEGFFLRRNATTTVTAARELVMKIDDAVKPKVMVVTIDGQEVKKIPVSLGKSTDPSSSGVMVIIQKEAKDIYDTRGNTDGHDEYVVEVQYSQRLTWSGEHIHAAPWSVQHQGERNVSHGCVNVSTANAKWLFEQTLVGDPLITVNTGSELVWGDGWTDWSRSFDEYAKGSAIPYTPGAPAPTATPST